MWFALALLIAAASSSNAITAITKLGDDFTFSYDFVNLLPLTFTACALQSFTPANAGKKQAAYESKISHFYHHPEYIFTVDAC